MPDIWLFYLGLTYFMGSLIALIPRNTKLWKVILIWVLSPVIVPIFLFILGLVENEERKKTWTRSVTGF